MPPFNHAFARLPKGNWGMVRLGIAPNRTASPKGLASLLPLGGNGFARAVAASAA